MKHRYLDAKKIRGFFLAGIIAFTTMLTLSSCLKNRHNDDEAPVSFITFIHSLPQYAAIDFAMSGVAVSSDPLLFTQNTGDMANSPYAGHYSGTYPFQVFTGPPVREVLRLTGTLEPNTTYSFFVATTSPASDTVVAVVPKDNLTAPTGGKAKIRFVNLVRNTSSYDLAAQNITTPLFTNKAYKANGDFIEVAPGDYVYDLKDAGTTTIRATTTLKVEANKIYTIWASGGLSSATTT
ncbi:MAG: DUF4397 domain-containing protein, partial [Sphingobacteriales bacterium]